MTNQEIFDKAYIGLYSQGFKKCTKTYCGIKICVFSDDNGKHCAWGWVDESLDSSASGSVSTLFHLKTGVAVSLNFNQVQFGNDLQYAHDESKNSKDMKKQLEDLAKRYNLLVPILLERKK